MNRVSKVYVLAFVLVLLSAVVGCSVANDDAAEPQKASSETAEKDQNKSAPTLEEFVAAETKTADFVLVTYGENGEIDYEQEGTLWVTPDRFRYDLYEDGTLLRSVLTPDGEIAYFAQHDTQVSEVAVAPVANYMAKFNPPPTEAVEDGIDEETGALRMKYDVQETYTVPGAANSWYQEDIVFLVKDNAVVGIVTRGYAIDADGVAEGMQTTRRTLSNVQADVEIDGSVFELPYPVQ